MLIAGPNGAGKTTFALEYLPRVAGIVQFVNADLIAAGPAPLDRSLGLRRIAARVQQGGHSVARADVLRRFERGWMHFVRIYQSLAEGPLILSAFVLPLAVAAAAAQPPSAETNFQSACAPCHEGAVDRAPSRSVLHEMTADRVLAAMESGLMISMAVSFNAQQRRDIAGYITGKPITGKLTTTPPQSAMCKTTAPQIEDLRGPLWNGWGMNAVNSRFQSAASAGFSAAEVPRLKIK